MTVQRIDLTPYAYDEQGQPFKLDHGCTQEQAEVMALEVWKEYPELAEIRVRGCKPPFGLIFLEENDLPKRMVLNGAYTSTTFERDLPEGATLGKWNRNFRVPIRMVGRADWGKPSG